MWIAIILIFVAVLGWFLWYSDNCIVTSKHQYKSDKISENFENFKIVQVSDLHNKRFGKGQQKLISKIKAENPDVIFVTGDMIDRRRTNATIAMEFVEKAVEFSTVFYVCGNHEAKFGIYEKIKPLLKKAGVVVLDKATFVIEKAGEKIQVTGFPDPWENDDFYERAEDFDDREMMKYCKNLEKSNLNILLMHRAELAKTYAKTGVDLAFCGHAHGGQFQIPIIKRGILSPHQGFLPKYASGTHKIEKTTVYISRGLGNSRFPIRLFNRPEIVSVTLNVTSKTENK